MVHPEKRRNYSSVCPKEFLAKNFQPYRQSTK